MATFSIIVFCFLKIDAKIELRVAPTEIFFIVTEMLSLWNGNVLHSI